MKLLLSPIWWPNSGSVTLNLLEDLQKKEPAKKTVSLWREYVAVLLFVLKPARPQDLNCLKLTRNCSTHKNLRNLPVLVLNMILLLTIFYHLDKKAYQKDITKGLMPEVKENEPLIRIKGAHNFLYIVMIVIAVILSGVLPKLSAFQNAAGEVIGIPIFR